jgi:hypothetical protein
MSLMIDDHYLVLSNILLYINLIDHAGALVPWHFARQQPTKRHLAEYITWKPTVQYFLPHANTLIYPFQSLKMSAMHLLETFGQLPYGSLSGGQLSLRQGSPGCRGLTLLWKNLDQGTLTEGEAYVQLASM